MKILSPPQRPEREIETEAALPSIMRFGKSVLQSESQQLGRYTWLTCTDCEDVTMRADAVLARHLHYTGSSSVNQNVKICFAGYDSMSPTKQQENGAFKH